MNEFSGEFLTDCESVHGYVNRVCFKNGPPGRVGAELEWLVAPSQDPSQHLHTHDITTAYREITPLPGGSRLSLEPGGQVELSSQIAPDISSCWRGLEQDISVLDSVLATSRLIRLPTAIDACRSPVRLLRTPRYDAMAEYFEKNCSAGLVMMTSTASIQVNLDAGDGHDDVMRRWGLVHSIGPTLVAAFANSPISQGRITGWKSARQQVWNAIDSARIRPIPPTRSDAGDPADSWAEYALDAPVMMLRRSGRWLSAPGFTFRDWVTGRTAYGRPGEDDLAYHLTTLFPPVRPRGWYEIRYLDTQPHEFWPVPIAVVTALVEDHEAADCALDATGPVRGSWRTAAQVGLGDPALARAASRCFDSAIAGLRRLGADHSLVALVESFIEHYVAQRRSPADNQLREKVRR